MELSRSVVVQHHGYLNLTLDFQGQILKMLYLRNGRANWHGTKGMWVNRMLHPLCDFQHSPHPWPWPWIFKVKFWKSSILGMGWPIDTELKGCESIECWTHVVTFNVHLSHDLDLEFSRSNFENAVFSGIGGPIDMEPKRCESTWCYTHFVTFKFDLNHDLDLEFSKSNFEKVVSGMVWPILMEPKGCESIECWTHVVTFNITLTRDLRVKIWKCCISGMARPIDMERKGCKSIGYRNWYQDWGHCGVTNDLGSSLQPEGETRGLWWASQVVGDITMTEIEVSIYILSWCRIGD